MKSKYLFFLSFLAIALLTSFMMIIQSKTLQEQSINDNGINDTKIGQYSPPGIVEGSICFKLKEGVGSFEKTHGKIITGINSLDELFSKFEVNLLDHRFSFSAENMKSGVPDLSRIYKIQFPSKYSPNTVVRAFQKNLNIEYAEPIPINYICEIPNDELFDDLWHLEKIEAVAAWDIHKGENGPEVIIGIVDDAVDWRHNDLVDNAWTNLGEDADGDGHVIEWNGSEWIFDPDDENGVDDDGNGKIDDFVGWDFINENGEQDNDPTPNLPAHDHGTHCIGIANSRTNNLIMVASIPWNVKFVAAKMSNDSDPIFDYDAYEGVIYMAELGVDIITNSWSGPVYSEANREVIEYAQSLGCVVVAAAGNDANEVLNYPASYPGVVSVAATGSFDGAASFTSHGIAIDISAPGVNILSLAPNNLTQTMSGTSMATPLTAGLLALIKSYNPSWPNELIIKQCLATSDDIDAINPYLANKLGYGRINAFRALNETNVTIQQELRLAITDHLATDEDGDGIFEPGELIYLGFEILNYAVGLDTTEVTYTLSTNSQDITIVSDMAMVDVPSDNSIWADSAFQFQINPDVDSTKLIDFEIRASSDLTIPLDSIWTISIVVNQKGVLVYNGIGTGNSYSGEYIRDFLMNNFVDVFYTETFPPSLNGFDAVFLSFGNYGVSLSNGTVVSSEMTYAISDYLYEGGYVYEDCGSFFGLMAYFDYTNLVEMMGLFSVDTVITPMEANSISLLSGLNGSLAEGISFNESTQNPNYYIDIMEPDSNGVAMFEEDDYGVVAIQGDGPYGQKTVCFSYAIEHLEDDSLGTRDQLMANIAEFFGLISIGIDEQEEHGKALSLHVYPNPGKDNIYIKYSTQEISTTDIAIYNMQGLRLLSVIDDRAQTGENNIQVNISALPPGVYLISLNNGTDVVTRKLIIL